MKPFEKVVEIVVPFAVHPAEAVCELENDSWETCLGPYQPATFSHSGQLAAIPCHLNAA